MNLTKTRIAAAMVVMMALAVGGAAALTVDSETTTTAVSSDLTTSSVITDPHNSSVEQNIAIKGDSNTNTSSLANPGSEMSLAFVVNDTDSEQDGETLFNTSANWTQSSVSGAPDHYNTTVTNEKFGDHLQYDAGQNVTVDARITFNATETDESVTNITFVVDPATGDNESRVAFGVDERQSGSSSAFSILSSIGIGSDDDDAGAAKVNDSIGVTSNTTTITMSLDEKNVTDSFSEVSSAGASGDLSELAYAEVNGHTVPVFVESADASWLDTSSEAYGVLSSDGTTLTIENANDTFDSSTTSVDVSAVGNDKVGFTRTRSMLSNYDAGVGAQISASASAIDTNGDGFEG